MAKVTDEMVDAAWSVARMHRIADKSIMRAALEAALSRQGRVVSLGKVQALAAQWDDITGAFDRPDSGYTNERIVGHRRALTADLRALIGEDHG